MEHTEYKAVIYINHSQQTIKTIDQLNKTRSILSNYWPSSNILVVNCSHDYPLQKWLREEANGKREYPQIYIGDVRIGFISDLEEANSSGLLSLMCNKNMSSSLRLSTIVDNRDSDEDSDEENDEPISEDSPQTAGGEFIKTHVVTSWFDVGSWLAGVAQGVRYFLDSPAAQEEEVDHDWKQIPSEHPTPNPNPTVVQQPEASPVPQKKQKEEEPQGTPQQVVAAVVAEDPVVALPPAPEIPDVLEQNTTLDVNIEEDDFKSFDLEIFRTNWMWRTQPRVYRFNKENFERIEKTEGSQPVERVCAVFPYSTVSKVDKLDDKNIIIRFNNGSEDQHLFSESPEKLATLLETINNRKKD